MHAADIDNSCDGSCLGPAISWDQDKDGTKDHHHMLWGKNREGNSLMPGKEVMILRRVQRVWCDKNNTQACDLCKPYHEGGFLPDEVKTTCRKCNTTTGDTCTTTECAVDKNGNSFCGSSFPTAPGGEHFQVFGAEKGKLFPAVDGSLSLPHITSHSFAGAFHSFLAVQILNTGGMDVNDAFDNSLKLSQFVFYEENEPDITNCVTVWWDPFGRIIDTKTLEPIKNCGVLLKNKTSSNQIVKTELLDNPFFKNPFITLGDGVFNFAVNPGIYFLFPSHSDFSFPVENQSLIDNAVARLKVFDPNGDYFDTNKPYNNSDEPIYERAGIAERRDILMTPKNSNYAGFPAEITYADIVKFGNGQLVTGIASHPKSTVQAIVNTKVVSQTTANLAGQFKLAVPGDSLNNNTDKINLQAIKNPLTEEAKPQTSISSPYLLAPIPNHVDGFVFNEELKTVPNTSVGLTIPSMNNITYSIVQSDENGFITFPADKIPPYEFEINILDPENKKTLVQTTSQFKKTNIVYLAESKNNLYSSKKNTTKANSKPSDELVKQVQEQTPKKVNAKRVFSLRSGGSVRNIDNSTNEQSDNNVAVSKQSGIVFMFVFLIVVGISVLGILFISKFKKRSVLIE